MKILFESENAREWRLLDKRNVQYSFYSDNQLESRDQFDLLQSQYDHLKIETDELENHFTEMIDQIKWESIEIDQSSRVIIEVSF